MVGMRKRCPFLLVEMMIAFIIMTGVMALLFTGFYSAIKAKNRIKSEKEKVMNLQRLKMRFAILFKDVIDVKQAPDKTCYYIRYQGRVDRDPGFRSEVEAILQIKNKTLTLTSWSKNGPYRQEILSTNIDEIKLMFFDEKEGGFNPQYPPKKPFMIQVIINGSEKEALPLFL